MRTSGRIGTVASGVSPTAATAPTHTPDSFASFTERGAMDTHLGHDFGTVRVHKVPADEGIADRVANDLAGGGSENVAASGRGAIPQPPHISVMHAGDTGTPPVAPVAPKFEIESREGGRPLPSIARESFERRLGVDLSGVRVHVGREAAAMSWQFGARAFTTGNHIFFGTDQYDPMSSAGLALLAHEVTHTVQQRGITEPVAQCQQEKPKPKKKIIAVTLLVDLDKIILDLDDGSRVTEQASYNGKPNPGTYLVVRKADGTLEIQGRAGGKTNERGYLLVYGKPSDVESQTYYLRVISFAMPKDQETSPESGGQLQEQSGAGSKVDEEETSDGDKGEKPTTTLSPKAQEKWRAINELMIGGPARGDEDPAETMRLFQILIDTVEDPEFSKTDGEPWRRFAKFLEQNREKIEGILSGSPKGTLTQEKIEKIIIEYGKFIAAEPVEPEGPSELETLEEFDKEFAYDPGWQRLSKADRKLLLEYARMTPDETSKAKIDFERVTPDMKLGMALKLSWKSWPAEVRQAALESFSDPSFVISLIVVMGLYVALWMAPEPYSKVGAAVLTVLLLSHFAWSEISGFAAAYSTLRDECTVAMTVADLLVAGDRFAKTVGQVGFDILMFIAMWRIGKRITPKIQKIAARRAVAKAEAGVKAAEAKPGSGVAKQAVGEAATLIETAKGQANETTATAVLDALSAMPEDAMSATAKQGLAKMRASKGDVMKDTKTKAPTANGDVKVLKMLEARQGDGEDISHFLADQMTPREVVQQTRAALLQAKGKLARAKLVEMETFSDPILRKARTTELIHSVREWLAERGILDYRGVRDAAQTKNIDALIAELSEAIQRTLLSAEFPSSKGFRILANLEIVREVPGFKSKAAWQAAERAAGNSGNTAGLYEKYGKLWKSITEVDALVVETINGKLRPVELEQMKSGDNSTITEAQKQNAKALGGLNEIASGKPDVKAFDRIGKHHLGKERTVEFDFSQLSTLRMTGRGTPGKGFHKDIPFSRALLEQVAKSIVENGLPPKPLPWIPPTSSEQEEEAPAAVEK